MSLTALVIYALVTVVTVLAGNVVSLTCRVGRLERERRHKALAGEDFDARADYILRVCGDAGPEITSAGGPDERGS